MEEVDSIICSSLGQIGCDIGQGLSTLTPEVFLQIVTECIQEIQPEITVPNSLPENITKRFVVASNFAEICSNLGYQNDIGYHTFLYPNIVDIRRLLMFLISRFPNRSRSQDAADNKQIVGNKYDILRIQASKDILKSLSYVWIPEYFKNTNKSLELYDITYSFFEPLPNLGNVGISLYSKDRNKTGPRTLPHKNCLISTVLHKNSIEENNSLHDLGSVKSLLGMNTKTENLSLDNCYGPTSKNDKNITTLKNDNDMILTKKRHTVEKLSYLNNILMNERQRVSCLQLELKIHERTKIILEDPKLNLSKLENLCHSTKTRQSTLNDQWNTYRCQLIEVLSRLREKRQLYHKNSSLKLQAFIVQLEHTLEEKIIYHNHLEVGLKHLEQSVARNDYTKRINEFITNIRKQRSDISKVLDDTRDLQKQLNSVTSQLERQFNYTDDLLFQSAKHDIHAKKAYKLLASLHAECNELLKTVSVTGYILKESRDLEVNIDHEKTKNTTKRLQEITTDIQSFYNVIKSIKAEIRQVENEILYI